jgi:hypothetical protein
MSVQLKEASQQLLQQLSRQLSQVSVWALGGCCFHEDLGLMCFCQAAAFADHVASGVLTAKAAEVERLRAQHADAVREMSAVDSKKRRLAEKVAALEAEKTDLWCQLVEERREANSAIAEAQAARTEANVARAEGSLASQRAEDLEAKYNALRGRVEKAEALVLSEIERSHAQFVAMYRELGARTADFEVPSQEAGLRFLEWLQEELVELPNIVTGFMSFSSLVTCEGAMNALSREGCKHYEVFDQADENFECEIFKVEDPVVKQSAGALFDRIWGPHGPEAVRERTDRAIGQVRTIFVRFCVCICVVFADCVCCCCRWSVLRTSMTLEVWSARCLRQQRSVWWCPRMLVKAPRPCPCLLWPVKNLRRSLHRRTKVP